MLIIELIKLKRNYSLLRVNINIFLSDTIYNADYKTTKNMKSEKLAKIFLQD